ncbi:MAG: GIY-YIG nuclease family protein [Clostridia bacterium]
MPYYSYILRCADGSLYSGYTANIKKRLATHNSGKGAKYTRAHLPVELAFIEEFEDKSAAMRREYEYKKLSHAQKLILIDEKPILT